MFILNSNIMSKLINLVYDPKLVQAFDDKFLIEGETYLSYLSSRRKYAFDKENAPNIGCINRKTFQKGQLLETMRLYEVAEGVYVDHKKDKPIPTETLAVYVCLNPRDVAGACKDMAKTIMEVCFSGREPSLKDGKIQSYLHKHFKRRYIGIDIDTKSFESESLLEKLYEMFPKMSVIETKGGYHVVINKTEIDANTGKFVYSNMKRDFKCVDLVSNDLFSPLPGTLQACFPIKF